MTAIRLAARFTARAYKLGRHKPRPRNLTRSCFPRAMGKQALVTCAAVFGTSALIGLTCGGCAVSDQLGGATAALARDQCCKTHGQTEIPGYVDAAGRERFVRSEHPVQQARYVFGVHVHNHAGLFAAAGLN